MGFDDFFEHKNKYSRHGYYDNHDKHSYSHKKHFDYNGEFFSKLSKLNTKLY